MSIHWPASLLPPLLLLTLEYSARCARHTLHHKRIVGAHGPELREDESGSSVRGGGRTFPLPLLLLGPLDATWRAEARALRCQRCRCRRWCSGSTRCRARLDVRARRWKLPRCRTLDKVESRGPAASRTAYVVSVHGARAGRGVRRAGFDRHCPSTWTRVFQRVMRALFPVAIIVAKTEAFARRHTNWWTRRRCWRHRGVDGHWDTSRWT